MAVILTTTTQSFIGVSGDTKPTNPPAGSEFYEIDTHDSYIFDGTNWILRK